jgi:hypothetical protein
MTQRLIERLLLLCSGSSTLSYIEECRPTLQFEQSSGLYVGEELPQMGPQPDLDELEFF